MLADSIRARSADTSFEGRIYGSIILFVKQQILSCNTGRTIYDRQFDVVAPNQVWTTDITYVWTLEGWLYVAVVIDLFSRQVVGWAIVDHMRTALCVKALQMAFWRRKPEPGLLHHSDRGSQYASHEYRSHLSVMKMKQSMSRKGNCWDNSPTERFFLSLKYEQLNYEKFKTKEKGKEKEKERLSIIDYLAFYNGKRSHSKLGYQSPMQFEYIFSVVSGNST
ncbi:IS3 family transposase [uncultured Kiloniella sp.]|uniref:IS3 family transposase n=1 Tax=uncultured Kiloniella sp. TaxID=1133091 RepID=UPI002618D9EE|nr:IS3 family transposase [uncultured Kiloniella sp.]